MFDEIEQTAFEKIMDDIFAAYTPHVGEGDAEYQPTSVEMADKLSETITISPNQLAIQLTLHGYHTKLVGSVFRWQIDLV